MAPAAAISPALTWPVLQNQRLPPTIITGKIPAKPFKQNLERKQNKL